MLALALPFLSLSFGYVPAKHELDMAAQLVQANADKLQGWEISSLVWAAARLGYRPADSVMDALLQQVLLTTALAITFCTLPTFTARSSETPSRPLAMAQIRCRLLACIHCFVGMVQVTVPSCYQTLAQ